VSLTAPKIAEALRDGTARLAAAGIDSAMSDARLLLMHALGIDRTGLLLRAAEPLPQEAAAHYAGYLARRAAREPVSRILGHREFWSLDFALGPATLDPRPDSETLVEAALAAAPDRPPSDRPLRVLDLGTGTGCLLLAVLHDRAAAFGIGVDRSEAAARVARDNARALVWRIAPAFWSATGRRPWPAASTSSCPTRPISRSPTSRRWSPRCASTIRA
jgi:release factor glutamine methyltransferase